MTTNAVALTSPGELLAVVPYVLGFHPDNSVVVLCLRGRRLGLTQRLDLPAPEHVHLAVAALLPSLTAEDPDAVVLVGYQDGTADARPMLEALSDALATVGTTIHDRLVVRGGRWRSLDCQSPVCCPSEGTPLPEPGDVPGVVAEFVGLEVAPHPSRAALVRQLEPGPQARDVAALVIPIDDKEADDPSAARAELFAAWPRILDPAAQAPAISAEDAALAALSLWDVGVRDALVAWLSPGMIDPALFSDDVQGLVNGLERAWGHEEADPAALVAQTRTEARLIGLCAALPDHLAAPALSVLASFTWWRGNGALTRAAIDRALRCDPGYRLAQLLQLMVDHGIRPTTS